MTERQVVGRLADLIRETSSSLPEDVEAALRRAARRERRGVSARVVLETILENVALARRDGSPLCQDTGTLTFFVDATRRKQVTPARIRAAVAEATRRGWLRKNCIDAIDGTSHDDNCAPGAPVVHYVEGQIGRWSDGQIGDPAIRPSDHKTIRPSDVILLMKGGGSENMSRQYSLPDASLGAGRDLEGVRRCLLDAVAETQGYGCAPGILGVCIGGDRATGYEVAKEQLLRRLDDAADDPRLARLERRILREANTLGIGPMGLGGTTTLLGVKIAARPRVPASFFVTVAYMCWACRRRSASL